MSASFILLYTNYGVTNCWCSPKNDFVLEITVLQKYKKFHFFCLFFTQNFIIMHQFKQYWNVTTSELLWKYIYIFFISYILIKCPTLNHLKKDYGYGACYEDSYLASCIQVVLPIRVTNNLRFKFIYYGAPQKNQTSTKCKHSNQYHFV